MEPEGAYVIEPRGVWEHNAYQSDTQFVVEVKAVQVDPNKLVQGSRTGYIGEKLSLNFQNVEVRAVLQVIADFTGLNIITSDTVGGNLTLRLKDVPWDQALDIILRANKLGYSVDGTIVRVAPLTVLAEEEVQRRKLSDEQALSGELRVLTRSLSYAKAEELKPLLTATVLSQRGSIQVDARTNTIIITIRI